MTHFEQNIIDSEASILDAISRLDMLSNTDKVLTLFILQQEKLIGTLTDGDIRRGLLKGLTVNSRVSECMVKDFTFIRSGEIDVKQVSEIRRKGITLLPSISEDDKIDRVYDLQAQKSILPLECMIMAGGRGERLRPLTDTVPKPMLKLGDKPIIEHNIDRLIEYGIEKIYISIKYLGEQIVEYLGDGSSKGIKIEYIQEDKPLGTGGALSLVENFTSPYILLMNSDLFTDIDFEDLYLATIEQHAEMGIASIPYTVNIPYAIFDKEDSKILSFKEKPNNTHYANAGIYIFKTKWIDMIPKNEFFNITDLMQALLERNEHVIHNAIPGYWIDIGKHEDFERAREIMKHLDK